jgi:hypothetical protein
VWSRLGASVRLRMPGWRGAERGRLVGRVEHVVSVQATDFESLEMLRACMARVLRAERARSVEP